MTIHPPQMQQASTTDETARTHPFEIHIGETDAIWTTAPRATDPTHLVITPVDLHRRNIEQRLSSANLPKSDFDWQRIGELAHAILEPTSQPSRAVDMIDRRLLIKHRLPQLDAETHDWLTAAIGDPLEQHIDTLEQTRNELELVTGFERMRMQSFGTAAADIGPYTEQVMTNLLAGISQLHADLQTALQRRSYQSEDPEAVSETSLLCRATVALREQPSLWDTQFEQIETVSLVGFSMLTAPLEDFCRCLAHESNIDLHLHLRPGTGPAIREHLRDAPRPHNPGVQRVFDW